MENARSRTIQILTILSLLALTITSGCLETPDATPAKASNDALSKYGWVQVGDVVYESQEEEITGTVIKINTAMMTYQDEQLGQKIQEELRNLQNQYNVQADTQLPLPGSQLTTLRLVLPGGFSLPSGVTSRLVDSQVDTLADQNNIDNFKKVGDREITVKDGSTITANTYAGAIPLDDNNGASIDVMGIIAMWSGSNSNVIVIGIVPDGDINLNMEAIEKTIITIDGEAEIENILELIKTIE
ncbi:MAG TPA: hypothetical protein C5S50_08440 [Methanosarcinaceae archaeon]|nr:hypothetical protein [Methanosarcinaceae archaeon]